MNRLIEKIFGDWSIPASIALMFVSFLFVIPPIIWALRAWGKLWGI